MVISLFREGSRRGLRVEISDSGPGISDLAAAMEDGFSTGGGLGLGLGGSRRLVDHFEISPNGDSGVRVAMTVWMA